ncbi:MAG TPA: hypothetical protein P5298_11645 [Spirochaetia bacterium]|nr:hypothetical protein [Spirochaetia bacterium]
MKRRIALIALVLLSVACLPALAQSGRGGDKESAEAEADSKSQELFFSLQATVDVVHVNLATRKVDMGFTPGVGFGMRWKPSWWSLTDSFLGVITLVGANFIDIDDVSDFDYFKVSAVPVLSIAGFLSVGYGVSYNLSLKPGSRDTLEYILSFGLSTPVNIESSQDEY